MRLLCRVRVWALSVGACCGVMAVAGCSSPGGVEGFGFGQSPKSDPAVMAATVPSRAPTVVAMEAIVGASGEVESQVVSQITRAALQRSMVIKVDGVTGADLLLRGYMVIGTGKPANQARISYIWDVTRPDGQRLARETGEMPVSMPPKGADPWANVPPDVVRMIADKANEALVKASGAPAPGVGPSAAAVPGAPTR